MRDSEGSGYSITGHSDKQFFGFQLQVAREWWAEEEASVMRLCRKMARDANLDYAELLSEAYMRVPYALDTFDPDRGTSLRTHVLNTIRYYIFKLYHSANGRAYERRRRDASEPALKLSAEGRQHSESLQWMIELSRTDQVKTILERLAPEHAEVLRLRFLEAYDVEDLAWKLDCSKSTAVGKIKRALEAARQVIDVEQEG